MAASRLGMDVVAVDDYVDPDLDRRGMREAILELFATHHVKIISTPHPNSATGTYATHWRPLGRTQSKFLRAQRRSARIGCLHTLCEK